MAVGGAHVVAVDAMVVGEFDFRVLGVGAVADKGKAVLLLGPFGRAQQVHAQHARIKVDGTLQVADAQHGVQQTHGEGPLKGERG